MRVLRNPAASRQPATDAPPGQTPQGAADEPEATELLAIEEDPQPAMQGRRQQQRVPAPPVEMEQRLRKAIAFVSAGMTRSRAVRALMADTGCDHGAAVWLVGRVWEQWTEDFEAEAGKAKVAQIERLRRDLVRMRSGQRPPWPSIARHEDLLANIQGTKQPVRVQVDFASEVRQSLLVIVSELSAKDQQALIAEQLELERRARTIEAEGVAV